MEYTIDYKFHTEIFDYMEEHIALIRDESGEAVMCIAGRVIDGWTKEAVVQQAQAWINRRTMKRENIMGDMTADPYMTGHADHPADTTQAQATRNTQNAERVAAEYSGVAVAIKDTETLKAKGCEYKTWEWIDMADNGAEISYSTEWQKDGRLLTVICQDYFLVL